MARRLHLLLAGMLLLWSGSAMALPDLHIGLLWGTEENDNCITQVHYILQILNVGDEPSGPFTMHVVFDAPELPGLDELDLYKGISHLVEDPIEPSGMFQIELWWKEDGGVPEGDWVSWMHIDIFDDVAEENEEDNSEGPIYLHTETIMCEPPNLYVDDLVATVDGTTISYTVTASNIDVIDVPYAFRFDLYRDRDTQPGYYEEGNATAEFEGIAKGETVTLEHQWDAGEDGVYMAYAVVDGWNTIFETSEADNIIGPIPVVVCTECPDCADNEKVDGACKCGGEPVGDGWCCDGVHVDDDCASLIEEAVIEVVEEATAEPEPEVVAQPEPGYEIVSQDLAVDLPGETTAGVADVTSEPKKDGSSSGCTTGQPTGSVLWLLLLLSLTVISRRRAT